MGLRNWIVTRLDRSRFTAAMSAGDFEGATEIANRSDIDKNLAQEAQEKAGIAQSLQNGSGDQLADRLYDNIEKVIDTSTSFDADKKLWAGLVFRAQVRKLVQSGDNTAAIELAARIGDMEIQSQTFRCIAATIAAEKPEEARSLIMCMKNRGYRQEELRNLCFSRVALRDFTTAQAIVKGLRTKAQEELSYNIGELAKKNLFNGITSDPPILVWGELVEFVEKFHSHPEEARWEVYRLKIESQIPLALLACSLDQYEEAVTALESIPVHSAMHVQFQRGLYATFSTSLAYAGKRDQALKLLSGCTGPPLFTAKGHLLAHFPYDLKHIQNFAIETDDTLLDDRELESRGSLIGLLAIELVAIGQFNNAKAIVSSLQNSGLRRVVIRYIVDFIYVIMRSG